MLLARMDSTFFTDAPYGEVLNAQPESTDAPRTSDMEILFMGSILCGCIS